MVITLSSVRSPRNWDEQITLSSFIFDELGALDFFGGILLQYFSSVQCLGGIDFHHVIK